jgi:hypothetical protein
MARKASVDQKNKARFPPPEKHNRDSGYLVKADSSELDCRCQMRRSVKHRLPHQELDVKSGVELPQNDQ